MIRKSKSLLQVVLSLLLVAVGAYASSSEDLVERMLGAHMSMPISGKGHGKGHSKGHEKGSGKGNGKGIAKGPASDEEHVKESGKGIGKGSGPASEKELGKGKQSKDMGSSEDDVLNDYMDMYMSMEMSMKGSKSTKSSKVSKSSKSAKSSKIVHPDDDEDNGDGGEVGKSLIFLNEAVDGFLVSFCLIWFHSRSQTVDPPTMAPVDGTITSSPTSENSIPIRATPFALMYDGEFSRIPSDDEFAALAELTRIYLEELMLAEFEQTSLTTLDDFLTFMIRNQFRSGQPVQADYRCTGLFNPSSIFLPTVRELNSLVDAAFTGENLDEYVSRIQGLPSANIFSTTTGMMKGLATTPVPQKNTGPSFSEGGSNMKMGLAAAAAGIVVLAAGAVMIKRNQTSRGRLEDPYNENLKGDSATVAGETCNASIDGSSAWRKTSPYITSHDIDESELEDEALDDDESTMAPSRNDRASVFRTT